MQLLQSLLALSLQVLVQGFWYLVPPIVHSNFWCVGPVTWEEFESQFPIRYPCAPRSFLTCQARTRRPIKNCQ